MRGRHNQVLEIDPRARPGGVVEEVEGDAGYFGSGGGGRGEEEGAGVAGCEFLLSWGI